MKSNHKVISQHPVSIDPLMLKDVWNVASDLGVYVHKHGCQNNIYFDVINQVWLKDIAKKFIKYMAATRSFGTLKNYLDTIKCFSKFLNNYYPNIDFNNIHRQVIIDYLSHLKRKKSSVSKIRHGLSTLNILIKTGNMNGWFNAPSYLTWAEDYPTETKFLPRYIPEEVMQQLNQHIDALPEPIMRMLLLLQECGLRVGELLELSFDCLKRDTKGDFFIQFMRWKMKEETLIPISREAAGVIQEQQQFIRKNLEEEYHYLFCARKKTGRNHQHEFNPIPKVMSHQTFARFLRKLAEEYDIKDSSGTKWNFQSHQFRHTVATRMVNSNVPMYIIQRYLGHKSPAMTQRYAHIHDETLKKAVAEFQGKVVNVFGQLASLEGRSKKEEGRSLCMTWKRLETSTKSLSSLNDEACIQGRSAKI